MIWFISDAHFGHEKILEYEKEARPFSSLEEMHETLIENWNSKVQINDIVYMLGDMFMGDLTLIDKIMPRLHGHKVLICGNHDTKRRVDKLAEYCDEIHSLHAIKYKKKLFVLCHFPLREWMSKEYNSVHLYGHVHSNWHRNGVLQEPNSYHVGVDTNNLAPISIDEILNKLFPCYHKSVAVDGDRGICLDCGEGVQKVLMNGKEKWMK